MTRKEFENIMGERGFVEACEELRAECSYAEIETEESIAEHAISCIECGCYHDAADISHALATGTSFTGLWRYESAGDIYPIDDIEDIEDLLDDESEVA